MGFGLVCLLGFVMTELIWQLSAMKRGDLDHTLPEPHRLRPSVPYHLGIWLASLSPPKANLEM